MNLEITVQNNTTIATNVVKVADECLALLAKYEGLVATVDTLKADKQKCADINKLKKFIADQRIAFDKEVNGQPDVKAVHDALRSIELKCDEVRTPYWESCKAIEDANKAPEKKFVVTLEIDSLTAKQLDKICKDINKLGATTEVLEMRGA